MKRYLSSLLALVLVIAIAISGCGTDTPAGMVGNYNQDTLTLLQNLRTAVDLPDDSPDKSAAQGIAKQSINDYAALYRRDDNLSRLSSFTTLRTALNSLAAHYTSYPNRPLPQKLKDRLAQEFAQAEAALKRGS
ncbi:photosystem II protein Psb27 [Merismopedia glauca]|uniref:Photosystem II lipoprotein Psb27 n=1 Tax=Merismopedia glauca CCAP 1448/3 TaxID=1296344 RepID=A0A2T1C575_9CYAN|nr:photosystem II protein Psb27 [Merismopedia glauca]PSB03406.1 photosystem II protein Psb27 [Merismopedia glauca CCAP 1448/3]